MKKKFLKICAITSLLLVLSFASCASWERDMKSLKSDMAGGLQRIVNVYSYTGELIATPTH
jgi:hypothetical protein